MKLFFASLATVKDDAQLDNMTWFFHHNYKHTKMK